MRWVNSSDDMNKRIRLNKVIKLAILVIMVAVLWFFGNSPIVANPNQSSAPQMSVVRRTQTLNLSSFSNSVTYVSNTGVIKTANPSTTNITDTGEGWSWYLNAANGYLNFTLVLHGIDMDIAADNNNINSTNYSSSAQYPYTEYSRTIATMGLGYGVFNKMGIIMRGSDQSGNNYATHVVIQDGTVNTITSIDFSLYVGNAYISGNGTLNLTSTLGTSLRGGCDSAGYKHMYIGKDVNGVRYSPTITVRGAVAVYGIGIVEFAGGNINAVANVLNPGGTTYFAIGTWSQALQFTGSVNVYAAVTVKGTGSVKSYAIFTYTSGKISISGTANVIADTTSIGYLANTYGAVNINPGNTPKTGSWNSSYVAYGSGTQDYAFTVSNGGDNFSGNGYYVENAVVNIKAGTKPGYVFTHWTSSDATLIADVNSANTTFTMPASTSSVTANWTAAIYNIDYRANGGTLIDQLNYYIYGSVYTLPIPTWDGNTFLGWYEDALFTGSAITQISSSDLGHKTLWAKWDVSYSTLTSAAGSNGHIFPSGSIIYDGTYQTYTITPNPGFKIDTFTVGGVNKLNEINSYQYTIAGGIGNTTIIATFVPLEVTDIIISASALSNGSISPAGFVNLALGASQTFNFTPHYGFTVDEVFVDGVSVGALPSYTFTNVSENQTIVVKFRVLTTDYDIIYNLSGGTQGLNHPTIHSSGHDTTLIAPTKTGYTFAGWLLNGVGSPITVLGGSDYTADINLTASWTINQYTATFKDYNGNVIDESTVNYLSAAIAPSNPSRTGYTYTGWSTTFNSMTANIDVVAQYVINQYTATFKDYDGSTIISSTVNYLSAATAPSNPSRTGYSFTGWSTTFNSMTSNIDVVAQYVINQYTATFKDYDGSTIIASTVNYLSAATAPSNPSRTGYSFTGWSTSFNSMTSNIDVVAQYVINQYTATFKDYDGSTIIASTVDYLSAATAPSNPSRTGYSFTGWSTTFNSMTSNIDVVAQYVINQYTATFKDHDGSTIISSTVNYLSAATAPSNPSRTGYSFTGWSTTFNSMTANIDVVAQYVINQYTATFKDYNGNVIDESTVNYLTAATAPSNPTRTGYTFTGWSSSFDSMTANIDVVAQYVINQYTATFKDYDGSTIISSTVDYQTAAIAPSNPSRTGYTFTGWSSSFNSMTANIDVVAQYVINQYTATFKDHDGITIISSTVDYQTAAIAPSNPSRTGYSFTGWSTSFNSMTANIDVVAQYVINQYTATFKDYDGSTIIASTVDYLSAATAPSNPSRTGYTFTGWSSSFNSMTANIDVVAQYVINQYTATFKDHDGITIISSTVDYQTAAIAPSNPSRTGYTFTGWSTTFNSMTSNIDVVAQYVINEYVLEYLDHEGTVIQSEAFNFGASLVNVISPTPTRAGFVFNGWCHTMPTTMPDRDITMNAQWKKLSTVSDTVEVTTVTGLDGAVNPTDYVGMSYEIELNIEIITGQPVNVNDSTLVQNLIGKKDQSVLINISLFVVTMVGGSPVKNSLTESNQMLSITITIPLEQQGKVNYRIVRVHNNEATFLDATYDETNQTLTFETDCFSTYAIVYENPSSSLWWVWLLFLVPMVITGYFYRNQIRQFIQIKVMKKQ